MNKILPVSFSFIDRIFGTYYCPKDKWPSSYGLHEEKISENFYRQLIYPFLKIRKGNSNDKAN